MYEVRLPWKTECPSLTSNYGMAKGRLKSALKKLKEKNLLQVYQDILEDQVQRKFIEKVVEKRCPGNKCHYIPHLPVIREHHTTPIRIVFDASAKCPETGKSLNDMLHTGPSLVPELTAVMLRFRLNRYVCISDISKAFLMVGLNIEDRDYVRFLWPADPTDEYSELNTFRFRRVLFGATSSPFLLQATIRYHFSKYVPKYGISSEALTRNLYVDNLMLGADTVEHLLACYHESLNGYSEAGLPLREWIANTPILNEQATKDNLADTTNSHTVKMLGMMWNSSQDLLMLKKIVLNPDVCSKREILSESCKIFDPLGLFYPVTIKARMLIQDLWKSKCDWDTKIPEEFCEQWRKYVKSTEELFDCEVPRWIVGDGVSATLHVFADASKEAMGCCAYLVQKDCRHLLISKARVAPVKSLTIPKLELTSVLLGSRLAKYIVETFCQELTFESLHIWSDSQVALCWILDDKEHKNLFVKNRVNEIKCNIGDAVFHHINTEYNPADLLTRNKTLLLSKNELWWYGPDILTDPSLWSPFQRSQGSNADVLAMITEPVKQTPTENDGLPAVKRFNDYSKLLKVTSYVLRILLLKKPSVKISQITITPKELECAEYFWLIEHQKIAYREELDYLQEKTKIKPSLSYQFKLFLDDGLIKIQSRLQDSNLPDSAINPVLISGTHFLSDLLIIDAHNRTLHGSANIVIAYIRKRFWLPKCRQNVNRVLRNCALCRRLKGEPYKIPETPALPSNRVVQAEPFQYTGVDYTGALYVKEPHSKSTIKVYIALFTCLCTRAVHLEVSSNASAESFARVFRRFVAHQTAPQTIYSDRGSNFIGFQPMLTEILNSSVVESEFQKSRTEWKFIPAKAPWFGGVWERLVGITKKVLKKVLGNAYISLEEMQTIVVEVASRINKRPLTYVGGTIDEPVPLTPVQLLRGIVPDSLPIKYTDHDELSDKTFEISPSVLSRRHKHLIHLIEVAWTRWKDEYLLSLRERDRRNTPGGYNGVVIPQEGDVVLFQSDVGQKNLTLGRVTKLVPGKDGKVRVAQVKTQYGEITRPIAKLSYLESSPLDHNDQHLTIDKGHSHLPTSSLGSQPSSISRPSRIAAKKAAATIQAMSKAELI